MKHISSSLVCCCPSSTTCYASPQRPGVILKASSKRLHKASSNNFLRIPSKKPQSWGRVNSINSIISTYDPLSEALHFQHVAHERTPANLLTPKDLRIRLSAFPPKASKVKQITKRYQKFATKPTQKKKKNTNMPRKSTRTSPEIHKNFVKK